MTIIPKTPAIEPVKIRQWHAVSMKTYSAAGYKGGRRFGLDNRAAEE